MDLIYFGHDHTHYIEEFTAEVTAKFPGVKVENADDSIKGYRRSVTGYQDKEYYPWLIAFGWYDFSLGFNVLNRDEMKAYIESAKQKYPEAFKA